MTQFEHDTVVPIKESELTKKEQVAEMFDDIAKRYDFLNRFLSAGIDIRWRKKAIKQLAEKDPQMILDVATGTADLAIMASGILKPSKIVGIDISNGMLNIGREKIAALNLQSTIELLNGDSEAISFPDNSFDAVMVAFGVRNFQNLEKGLSEIRRVLKPGGKLMVLEFSKPKIIGVSSFYKLYMNVITPAICRLFSKNVGAYKYLNESIQKFPERENFTNILDNLGYTNTYYKPLSLGICSILLRRKIIYIAIGILMFPFKGFSQEVELNLPDYDNKKFHFGINLGINKSHFNFTHHPSFLAQDSIMDVESINNTGINLAWLVNLNLSEHFDIRTFPLDLTFSEKAFEYTLKYPDLPGGETPVTIKKVQSISLSFPIQIHFTSDRINNFKVYTIAGIKADLDLAANAGKKNADDIIQLKKFDYGVEAGLGFHIFFPYFVLSPELKLGWGLSNLHSRNPSLKYSSNIDKINSRMINFSLTVE